MSAKKLYAFFDDPGHGWLAVPRAELKAMEIHNKISPYSYQHKDMVYLEEDCDATLFIKTKVWPTADWRDHITSVHQDPCPIRDYQGYRA